MHAMHVLAPTARGGEEEGGGGGGGGGGGWGGGVVMQHAWEDLLVQGLVMCEGSNGSPVALVCPCDALQAHDGRVGDVLVLGACVVDQHGDAIRDDHFCDQQILLASSLLQHDGPETLQSIGCKTRSAVFNSMTHAKQARGVFV